ncbi:MAG: hypothetical protein IIX06_05990 [Bacteroidales bacterium]|nr:hypothetical protein [Bacteroidales bacterium]
MKVLGSRRNYFLLPIELVPLLLKVQQPKANSQKPTANSQQPKAKSQKLTANSQQPIANSLSLNYFQRELKR